MPQAMGRLHRPPLRKVRGQVRDLRLVCAPDHLGQDLRRVQLRHQPQSMRRLQRTRHLRWLLLQGVRAAGEGSRWLPQDHQFRLSEGRPVLRAEEVRLRQAGRLRQAVIPPYLIALITTFCLFLQAVFAALSACEKRGI